MVYFKKLKDAKAYSEKFGGKSIWYDNSREMYYVL